MLEGLKEVDMLKEAGLAKSLVETRLGNCSSTALQLSQVPQPLLREICGVAWPHSLATAPLCQLVRTPEPISGAH